MDDIQRALDEAQSGNFSVALQCITAARKSDPRNIYLIGLEKRFAQLVNDDPSQALSLEEREEIIGSLQALAERAIEDANRRREEKPETENRSAGVSPLTALKEQYFKHADACIRRGDYEAAHLEVRRVQILDPDDLIAKEYELKILQLEALEKQDDRITRELRPVPTPVDPPPAQPVIEPPPSYAAAETLMHTEPPIATERKSRKMMLIGALVFLAALGGVFIVMSLMPDVPEQQPVAQSAQPAAAKPEIQDPTPSEVPATTYPLPQIQQSTLAQPPAKESIQPAAKPKGTASEERVASQPKSQAPSGPKLVQSEQRRDLAEHKDSSAQPLPQATAATVPQTGAGDQKPSGEGSEVSETFVAVENPPQIVELVKPHFPEILIRNGIHGRVIAQVQIGTDGKPLQARVLKTTNSLYNDAVIEALMNSRYTAGMMSRGPVTAWLTIPFKFK